MKKLLFSSLLAGMSVFATAQFPAPDSFHIDVHYITIDQSDWCDGHIVQGPAYCNTFQWQMPNTSGSAGTLYAYRIYKDAQVFLSLPSSQTQADTSGAFWGTFYATALYANPAEESNPSNVVVIGDLPFAVGETGNQASCGISYDFQRQQLNIDGADRARELWVFNLLGMPVWHTPVFEGAYDIADWAPGAYVAVLRDNARRRCVQRVLVSGD